MIIFVIDEDMIINAMANYMDNWPLNRGDYTVY